MPSLQPLCPLFSPSSQRSPAPSFRDRKRKHADCRKQAEYQHRLRRAGCLHNGRWKGSPRIGIDGNALPSGKPFDVEKMDDWNSFCKICSGKTSRPFADRLF
jgi:hypothetical protein